MLVFNLKMYKNRTCLLPYRLATLYNIKMFGRQIEYARECAWSIPVFMN